MSELDPYDYQLPEELIAQYPVARRTDARLMVVDRQSQSLQHRYVRDLPELLEPGDCVVLNDTRVIPARLVGRRTRTGGRWFGLYLESDERGHWRLLCKTRGKLKPGEHVTLQDRLGNEDVQLLMLTRLEDGTWVAQLESDEPTMELLERIGRIPLPHYIRDGEMDPSDWENYQTVFARRPGAVAAPTAGLHFTRQLLEQLFEVGIEIHKVTLHVGLGTFRPISAPSLDQHRMHAEWGQVAPAVAEALNRCRQRGQRLVAVGSTVVRVLETAAAGGKLQPWEGRTDLFIRPPYRFRAVDVLMTNFHLPRTTLLVMVHAFGGSQLMRQAYEEAIRERYRFFSYGDAMLIV